MKTKKRRQGMTSLERRQRQQKFIQCYLKDEDMAAAARFAGVTYETAKRWLAKEEIRDSLEKANEVALALASYNKAKWIKDVVEVLDRAMGRRPKNVEREGIPEEYEFNSVEARRTLELLGKYLGMEQQAKTNVANIGKVEITWKGPQVEEEKVLDIGGVIECVSGD